MADRVQELVFEALKDFGTNEQLPGLEHPEADTLLFGANGVLDSLALVSLIADLETMVEERMGIRVTLADERAMSRNRSPFRTADTLVDYIREMTAAQQTP